MVLREGFQSACSGLISSHDNSRNPENLFDVPITHILGAASYHVHPLASALLSDLHSSLTSSLNSKAVVDLMDFSLRNSSEIDFLSFQKPLIRFFGST